MGVWEFKGVEGSGGVGLEWGYGFRRRRDRKGVRIENISRIVVDLGGEHLARKGKLEGWKKDGRRVVEGWKKDGRMEGWKDGRTEEVEEED